MELAPAWLDAREFVIRCHPDNAASSAVARRLGFRFVEVRQEDGEPLQWWVHPGPPRAA